MKIIPFFGQILAQCVHGPSLQITQPKNPPIWWEIGVLSFRHWSSPLTHKVHSSANLLPTSMKSTLSLLQKSTHSINWQSITCGNIPHVVKWTKPWGWMGLHPPGFHHFTTRGLHVVKLLSIVSIVMDWRAGAKQHVYWFLGGKGLGIQQGTSVWVGSFEFGLKGRGNALSHLPGEDNKNVVYYVEPVCFYFCTR